MPGLSIKHTDDISWREVKPQSHGYRRAAVHVKTIDRSPERVVLYTRYDPGLVVERHGHRGDEVIFVLEGDLMVGDLPARAGSTIILERETPFGPLIASNIR